MFRSTQERPEEKKNFNLSVGNNSNSSNSSGGKLASVSTAPTNQKESLLLGKQTRLSNDLEQINEDVHVEDACEDELNNGRDSIT